MDKSHSSCLLECKWGWELEEQGPASTSCLCPTGKNPTDEYLEGMMSEAPGPINFTMFLTMFGEKLNGTDPEDVIRNAFACFDEEASGTAQPLCLAASMSADPWEQLQSRVGVFGTCGKGAVLSPPVAPCECCPLSSLQASSMRTTCVSC